MYNLTFAVKENVIKNGALNTNPSFENWKANQLEAGCTLIDIDTEDKLFLSQGNLIVVNGEIVLNTEMLKARDIARKKSEYDQLAVQYIREEYDQNKELQIMKLDVTDEKYVAMIAHIDASKIRANTEIYGGA